MPIRMTLLVMALAALAAPFAASTAPTNSPTGKIAFATDRAGNLRRAVIYSVGLEGRDRRLVARPEPATPWLTRSPGGKLIAYVRSEDSVSVLYVAGVTGGVTTRIPAPGGQFADAVFSRDGKKLAVGRFVSCGSGCYRSEIDVVRVDGSGLHRVAETGWRPSWSPDGRRLVYLNGTDIRAVGSDGRNDRHVASGHLPQWAPRGNRIVFVATRGGYGVACFVNADGSREECSRGFSAKSILWAPNGKSIALRHSRLSRLGVLDAHGKNLRLLGSPADRITPAAFSPDGRRLAFFQGGLHTQILVRDLRGRQRVRQVTHEPKFTRFSNVQWRNGRISYVASLDTNDFEIAVMNGDGSGARTLTHNDLRDREPAWSPDGRDIVFSRTQGPSAGLRLMKADGSGQRALTRSGLLDSSPAWSPDGSRIAFVRSRTPFEPGTLLLIGLDGAERRLASVAPLPGGLSWSPDGKSIVVVGRLVPAGADLFVVDVQADTARRVMTGLFPSAPAWSPDGSRILFAGPCSGPDCRTHVALYEIHPDATGLRRLIVGIGPHLRSAWTIDGRILFAREFHTYGSTNQAIAVANGDGTGEVQLTRSLSVNVDPAWTD